MVVMGVDDPTDRREVVSRRAELIELLDETGPLEPRDIVDQLNSSRSTVNRALGELTDAGIVVRHNGEYTVTTTGSLAVSEFRRHQQANHAIFRSKELVDSVSDPDSIPTEFLINGHISLADDTEPFVLIKKIATRVRRAGSVRAYFPMLFSPHLLRTWHQTVTNEEVDSVAILDDELSAVLQNQYPHLLTEIDKHGTVSVLIDHGLPYGLILSEHDNQTTVSVIVYEDNYGVRGILYNDSDAAVARAREQLNEFELDAVGVDDAVDNLSSSRGEAAIQEPAVLLTDSTERGDSRVEVADRSLPLDLRTQGFVRLSTEYFDSHNEASPEVSWRTGFTLSEVRAGHAAERVDENSQNIVTTLIEKLRGGENHTLLGPPGVGKSTTCMAVACEWYDRQIGPVLYRSRGDGDQFTSPSLLKTYLRRTEGHTLVVVEDGVREEANTIFNVMQSLDGREDISFLLDSRESEWRNVDDFTLSPRQNAYRRTAVETTKIPELDSDGCKRFISKLEQLVGTETELSSSELRTRIANKGGTGDSDRLSPGSALLAQSQLLIHADIKVTDDASNSNTLENHIRGTIRSLFNAEPDLTIELGLLISILDAAGLTVTNEYLHALAENGQHGAVEEALSEVKGKVLFGKKKTRAEQTEYRTHHEAWSRMFIEQLLEMRPESEARDMFGRCVSDLLGLAADATRRSGIKQHIPGQTPHINRIEANPEVWVEALVKRIFELGVSHSQIAPLYGRADDGTIDVPEICPAYTKYKMNFKRAKMNGFAGRFRFGKEEAERLISLDSSVAELDEAEATKLRFFGYFGVAKFHRIVGQQESAHDHAKKARNAAQVVGDVEKEAKAQLELVRIEYSRNNSETGQLYLEELQTLTDEHDFSGLEAVALTDSGRQLVAQGEHPSAKNRLRGGLERARATGRPQEIGLAQHALGLVLCDETDFDTAETHLLEGLERVQASGNTVGQTALLATLAQVKRKVGDLSAAESLLDTAVKKLHENPEFESFSYWVRAGVMADRGNFQDAIETAGQAAALAKEGGISHVAVRSYCLLARVTVAGHEYDRAEEYLKRGREKCRELGNDLLLATCSRLEARLEYQQGNHEDAKLLVQDALDPLKQADITDEVADCLRIRGLCEFADNNVAKAEETLERGLRTALKSDVTRTIGELHGALARLRAERRDIEAAQDHLEQARRGFQKLSNEDRVQSIRDSIELQ